MTIINYFFVYTVFRKSHIMFDKLVNRMKPLQYNKFECSVNNSAHRKCRKFIDDYESFT